MASAAAGAAIGYDPRSIEHGSIASMGIEDDELIARAKMRIGSTMRGKYRIDRILGWGGMGVVYAATHRNGRPVAIKLLHPELSLRADLRTRFLREGHAANAVKHPGAVAVLDDDVAEDGSAFLVMEMLEGAVVEAVWERAARRLPLDAVMAIGDQLLDILSAAHAAGIIHRDIKPANVFLTRDGTIKVLDFGIARIRDVAASQATQTGMMMGTPAYMAPEQALGRTSEVDAQTDVWAVGAMLFSLVSGRYVHDGDTPQVMAVRAATTPATSLRSVLPNAPAEIVSAIDRALAFDKSARWSSASAMRDALRAAFLAAVGADLTTTPLRALAASYRDSLTVRTVPSSRGADSAEDDATTNALAQSPVRSPQDSPLLPLVGGTTSQPVSTPAPQKVPRLGVERQSARRWRTIALAAGAALILATIGIAVLATTGGNSSRASAVPTAPASVPSPLSSASAVVLPKQTGAIGSTSSQPPTVAVTDLPQSPAPPSKATPKGPAPPRAASTPVATSVVPPAQAGSVKDCNPGYEVDDKGIRHYKPECVQQ
jgi:serine/threonine-protein kinase